MIIASYLLVVLGLEMKETYGKKRKEINQIRSFCSARGKSWTAKVSIHSFLIIMTIHTLNLLLAFDGFMQLEFYLVEFSKNFFLFSAFQSHIVSSAQLLSFLRVISSMISLSCQLRILLHTLVQENKWRKTVKKRWKEGTLARRDRVNNIFS